MASPGESPEFGMAIIGRVPPAPLPPAWKSRQQSDIE